MPVAFYRPGQMNGQSGVQLNRLVDQSGMPDAGYASQSAATAVRATRGRIDRANAVTSASVFRRLGRPQPIRQSQLNEGLEQVMEAVSNGAYQVVTARLHSAAAKIRWGVARYGVGAVLSVAVNASGGVDAVTVTDGGTGYQPGSTLPVQFSGGSGATATATVNADGEVDSVTVTASGTGFTVATATIASTWQFAVEDADDYGPQTRFFAAVKHLECFNDGIKLEMHAAEVRDISTQMPNDVVTLRLTDADGVELYTFTGSLDQNAVDDFGASSYLPDVVANSTDNVILLMDTPDVILPGNPMYGMDAAGRDNWVTSPVLLTFDEGGMAYTAEDYARARKQLKDSKDAFGYIFSAGTQSMLLLSQLAALSYDTNCPFCYDLSGSSTLEAVLMFDGQLNMEGQAESYLINNIWFPAKSNSPSGLNPPGVYGLSGLRTAYHCRRNAETDNNGMAKKHWPISKSSWPINRTNIRMLTTFDVPDLVSLAQSRVNHAGPESYEGAQLYVFGELLTKAPVTNSLRKLMTTGDILADLARRIISICNAALHKPMADAIEAARTDISKIMENAETAGWLVPSALLGGAGFSLSVSPNAAKPYDHMDVSYDLSVSGVARVIQVSQSIVRRS